MGKTHFLIASRGRVGSNLLMTLLDSHPACRVRGEVLGPDYALSERQKRRRENHPWSYFEKEAWGRSRGKKAVGVKVFYQHLTTYPLVLEKLRADPAVKVVHLVRKNILRTHLSKRMAEITGQWTKGEGSPPAIELAASELIEAFQWTEGMQQRLRAAFRRHDLLELSYERLIAEPEAMQADLQLFLRLPLAPLTSPLEKQLDLPLRDLISNYTELKAHFADSEWIRFFDE